MLGWAKRCMLENAPGWYGVPLPELTVVPTAPQYMEQKATIDAVFALALGLCTYVNPVPTITSAPNLVRLQLDNLNDLFRGSLGLFRLEPGLSYPYPPRQYSCPLAHNARLGHLEIRYTPILAWRGDLSNSCRIARSLSPIAAVFVWNA
jgi:Prismane/CO dehydrogenase family